MSEAVSEESLERLGPTTWRLRLRLEAASLDGAVERRLAELRPHASAPGFRRGKAPLPLLRRFYGARLREQQWTRHAQDAVRAELARHGLVPALPPRLERLPAGDGVEATVEAFGELPSFDLGALVVRRPVVEIGPDDVDAMVARLSETMGASDRAGWREQVEASMRAELPEAIREEVELAVVEALGAAVAEPTLPAALVAAQIEALRLGRPAGELGGDVELEATARRLLAETLVLASAARQLGVQPDSAALYAETERLASAAPDPAAELDRIWADAAWVQEIEDRLLKRRVVDAVLARARVEDEPLRFAELAARRRARTGSRA